MCDRVTYFVARQNDSKLPGSVPRICRQCPLGDQLDQKVTAAALGAGENANAISQLLQQGPYARFHLDVKHVPLQTIEQYASGTVVQVQAIQSLQLGQS
jgi:hypothetical protein